MIHELVFLTIRPNQLGPVFAALKENAAGAHPKGRLVGALNCDIGSLNRVALITRYEDTLALQQDRTAGLDNADPYGCAPYLSHVDRAAYRKLSFARELEPGAHGPFYELRCYEIAPGGLPETEAAWARVIEQREALSPLLTVMGSLDTLPTRMVHIWPYNSLDARAGARAAASKQGIWPPPGGSNHVLSLRSEVFTPLPFSPLS